MVKEHHLTVDVYASWSDAHPRYRVYVDSDLLTERDFIWLGHDIYIKENIVVHLLPGQHNLRVEQVGTSGTIRTKNVTLDGQPSSFDFVTV
jgi:hypothetical protein